MLPTILRIDKVCQRIAEFDSQLSLLVSCLTAASLSEAVMVARKLMQTLPSDKSDVRKVIKDSYSPENIAGETLNFFGLRAAIFHLIDSNSLTLKEQDSLPPLMKVVSLGEMQTVFISFYIQEIGSESGIRRKEAALAAIFHDPQGAIEFEKLSEQRKMNLSGPWVRPMLRCAEDSQYPRQAIACLYRTSRDKKYFISRLEEFRAETDSAFSAYSELIEILEEGDLRHLLRLACL